MREYFYIVQDTETGEFFGNPVTLEEREAQILNYAFQLNGTTKKFVRMFKDKKLKDYINDWLQAFSSSQR